MKSTDVGMSWTRITPGRSSINPAPTHIQVNQRTNRTLVYGTEAGGLYRSTNGGQSWGSVHFGVGGGLRPSLVPDPSNPDILYASTNEGIFVSPDFGNSWTNLHSSLPLLPCSMIAPAKSDAPLLFAFGAGIGVQHSTDGGKSWHHADSSLGGSTFTVIDARPGDDRVFAVTRNALLAYSDSSAGWIPVGSGITGDRIRSLAFDRDLPDKMYAATSQGIFASSDRGDSWVHIAQKLRITPGFIDIHPWLHTRMFASGDQGLAVSTDKGETWAQGKPISMKLDVRSITYAQNDAGLLLAATADSTVILSSDGGINWKLATTGLDRVDFRFVSRDNSDPRLCYAWASSGESFRSTNNGLEWNRFSPPWKSADAVMLAFDSDLPSSIVALVNQVEVYYSPSGGGTWFRLFQGRLPAEVTGLHWSSAEETLYAASRDNGLFRLMLKGLIKKKLGE